MSAPSGDSGGLNASKISEFNYATRVDEAGVRYDGRPFTIEAARALVSGGSSARRA